MNKPASSNEAVVAACLILTASRSNFLTPSERFASLLQGWQATLRMIGSHPLLGVGPGNFPDYYTEFKLPQSVDELREPRCLLGATGSDWSEADQDECGAQGAAREIRRPDDATSSEENR